MDWFLDERDQVKLVTKCKSVDLYVIETSVMKELNAVLK